VFEDLCDENDLEFTEHRLRVEVMSLKKRGDVERLFRLYGTLARILAKRGNHLKAQDALNDAEFLVVEHKWRGTPLEVWCHLDRALVFLELGRPGLARRNLDQAGKLMENHQDEGLAQALAERREAVSAADWN